MTTSEPVVGLDRKIPLKEKLFFPAIGGFFALFNAMAQFYLMYFYTNIQQLNISYIGPMVLIVPIAAAVLMPVFGAFIDRHMMRWGRYRPWIFILLLGTGVGAFLTFIPVSFGQAGSLVYATVTFVIFSLFLSSLQAVIIGMTTVMTKRYNDRIDLAISGSVWAMAGSVIVSYTAMPVAGLFSGQADMGNGLQYYALICMIVAAILSLLIVRVTKERIVISPRPQAGFGAGLPARAFFKNKYALIAFFTTLILLLHNIRASFNIYYFQAVFNDTSMMATLILLSIAPSFAGLLVSPFVIKKFDLKNTLLSAVIMNIVTSAAVFFVPGTPFGAVVLYVLTGLGSLFVGIAQPAQNVMITFAADYGEWKYHISCSGFLGAVNGIAKALAAAILSTGIFSRLIIQLIGYTPQEAPTAAALIGIKGAVSFLPAIIFVILLLFVLRWDLTRKKHSEIAREIYTRSEE